MKAKRPSPAKFREVAEAKGGNIAEIAKALNCTRRVVQYWTKDEDSEYSQILEEVRESFIDMAETQLRRLVLGIPKYEIDQNGKKVQKGWVERPSEAAIIFTLKTQGKKRGYIERVEQTGADGKPLIPATPIPIVVMSPEEYAKIEAEEKGE